MGKHNAIEEKSVGESIVSSRKKYGYSIEGGKPVIGEIQCLGAKNFATKAMIAALLSEMPTTLTNVPAIGDVDITIKMLNSIGVKVINTDTKKFIVDSSTLCSSNIQLPDMGSNRMPIRLVAALLNRFEEVSVPKLGGCSIGDRRIDFDLEIIRQFGGEVEETEKGLFAYRKEGLKGTQVKLSYPSVSATETFLYLSVLAEGRSLISNAALEPEIIELITLLRSMGAVIFTSPRRKITVEGVKCLQGTRMQILGDRIEAATWGCLACASNGSILIHGIRPDILGNFLSYFQKGGGGIEFMGPTSIRFFRRGDINPMLVETDVYPGFSTDWQQSFAVLLTQANGASVIHETVYENRFDYLEQLNRLGARTHLTNHCLGEVRCRYKYGNYNHSAIIMGPTPLVGTDSPLTAPDLRGGLALVIAAAIAKGKTVIADTHLLERGYGDVISRLTTLNLAIERVSLNNVV